MEGLNKYNELQFKYTEPQFIPHPLTWLNQERWKDEVIEKKPNQSNQSNKLNLPDYYQKFKGLDKLEKQETDEESVADREKAKKDLEERIKNL